jgi:hypothetical protein
MRGKQAAQSVSPHNLFRPMGGDATKDLSLANAAVVFFVPPVTVKIPTGNGGAW